MGLGVRVCMVREPPGQYPTLGRREEGLALSEPDGLTGQTLQGFCKELVREREGCQTSLPRTPRPQ